MKNFNRSKDKCGMTVIELMIVLVTLAILAGTSILTLQGYFARSRLSEAYVLLGKMADQQIVYYQNNRSFIPTGPENIPPPLVPTRVNFTGNWISINFSTPDALRFGYQCYEDTGPDDFICEAQGDQDGDGNPSIIQIRVGAGANGSITKSSFFSFDELE